MTRHFIWYPSAIHLTVNFHYASWYAGVKVPLTSDRWKPYKAFTVRGQGATVWRANEGGVWLYTATLDISTGPVNPAMCEGLLSMREAMRALERKTNAA